MAEAAMPTNLGSTNSDLNSSQDLSRLIDDEDYQCLKRCFAMVGKGRRPNLPSYPALTNKLLLQLYFIEQEKQTSMAELKTWLEKLIPNTVHVTESKIYHQVMSVLNTCPTLDKDTIMDFLSQEFDFTTLHQALSACGLTRLHLINAEPYSAAPRPYITNEVVFHLEHFRTKNKETHTFVTKWIKKLCSESCKFSDAQLKSKIAKVMKACTAFSKNKKINEQNQFLLEPFIPPISVQEENICSSCNEKDLLITNLKNCLRDSEDLLRKEKSRTEALSLENMNYKNVLLDLQKVKCQLDSKITSIESKIKLNKDVVESLKKQVRVEKSEKEKIQLELQQVKSSKSKLYTDNYLRKRRLKEIETEKEMLQEECKVKEENMYMMKKEIGSMKKKIKSEQDLKSKHRTYSKGLQKIYTDFKQMLLFDDEKEELQLRERTKSHRYSDSVRNTYYALQGEANVAATNCCKVVSTVARNLFNVELNDADLPCETSSINFSNEANIIAKHQVVQEIKNSNHFIYICL